MGIKSSKNRHTEIRNKIFEILGMAGRNRYDAFVTKQKKHPAKRMSVGKKCSPTKDQRNAIRALMMVGFMTSGDMTFSIQLKEQYRNDPVGDIEAAMLEIWQAYQDFKSVNKDVGLAAKTTHFFNNPLEFAKRYSLLAMGQFESTGGAFEIADITNFPDWYKGPNNDGVIKVSIKKADLTMGWGLRIMYDGASNKKCYFLGWSSNCLTKLTIPNFSRTITTPNVFFTASLSGCSVFIKGNLNTPEIFHFGSTGVEENLDRYTNLTRATKNAFARGREYRDVLWKEAFLDLTDPVSRSMAGIAEINKHDYLGTNRIREFENRMKNKYKKKLEKCGGGGTVFGVRNNGNGNWTFYLQENAVVIYTNSNKKKVRHTLPLCIQRVYPLPKRVVYEGKGHKLPDIITDNDIWA